MGKHLGSGFHLPFLLPSEKFNVVAIEIWQMTRDNFIVASWAGKPSAAARE
jgi:hypothetical protein